MRIKLSINCPFTELSLGDGVVLSKDSDYTEVPDTKELEEAIKAGFIDYEGTIEKKEQVSKKDPREVWVFAETLNGRLARVSLELLGKAVELAKPLNTKVAALLLTDKDTFSKELISYGADKIYLAQHDSLKNYDTEIYTQIICDGIKKYSPQIIVYGATHIGRDLAPRIARRIKTGLTADCTGLEITDKKELLQTRPAFGGNLMAQILCKNMPQMSTVRPGVMQILPQDTSRKGEMIKLDLEISKSKTKLKESVKSVKKVINLEEADIIVAGGRGLASKENFLKLIPALAKKLNAEIGSSRAAVDAGWIEKAHQVGQTGKTVRPKVYIAFGISGAIQHRAGMQNADLIIAVNKDASAPIFKIADYGFVADVNEFIPALIEALQ